MQSDGQGAAGGRTPPVPMVGQNLVGGPFDTGTRRRLFAGFRPLSGFARGRFRSNSTQHRSISLPESNYPIMNKAHTHPPCRQSFSYTETRSYIRSYTYKYHNLCAKGRQLAFNLILYRLDLPIT